MNESLKSLLTVPGGSDLLVHSIGSIATATEWNTISALELV